MQIPKLRDFNYSTDRLVVADIDSRDKSYIVIMEKKINTLIEALNETNTVISNMQRQLGVAIKKAEEEAADAIKNEDRN